MSYLDKLERKLGPFSIPHLTEILIFGQVVVWAANAAGWLDIQNIVLIPDLVLKGEYRRLATFLFIPPNTHPVFLIFAWMFFYFMGRALEDKWGEFHYNLFILVGYAATVAVSFFYPWHPVTNAFIGTSIFLAFALLYPDFMIYIFLILPVRIKWVAAFTWATYAYGLIFGSAPNRLYILASISNIALFFGADLLRAAKQGSRKMTRQTLEVVLPQEPFHKCAACGITDQTHPRMDFRYCSRCEGSLGYCADHIHHHEHR